MALARCPDEMSQLAAVSNTMPSEMLRAAIVFWMTGFMRARCPPDVYAVARTPHTVAHRSAAVRCDSSAAYGSDNGRARQTHHAARQIPP